MRDEGAVEDEDDEPVVLPTNVVLQKIWLWFEYPKYSKVAKLVATFSITFIAVSIYVLCAETIDHDTTSTTDSETSEHMDDELALLYDLLESVCISWFTLEFLLRFVSCPNKLRFMLDILNLIDLAAIVPYYFQRALGDSESEAKDIVDAFRLLRVSRLFKLARHLDELKVLAKTVRSTWRELVMILFFILITTAIFSGWTFYAENEAQQDSFSSIPASAWFVIVSLTNVGYGDMVPVTIMGKMLGAVCTLAGVLVIALPSPVIVTKFRLYYEKKKRPQLAKYKF
ncbi:Potassium voltage-gated channel sub A member 2 [Desmophyllum pertusum]|uniref:Potassium voltage-gated channel sub A member 2 n=1 Tax=Desmophyllum pertusum TaxID=174260 RepID=A0A9W9YSI6_9CNID|nr:Potassium voltage-gated channel sub A member 2 [Desmophyllum pertusum]